MTTILIVEDEARIAAFVAKGLRAAGFVPEIYSTGSEAVEAALQGRGALMLLDVGVSSRRRRRTRASSSSKEKGLGT